MPATLAGPPGVRSLPAELRRALLARGVAPCPLPQEDADGCARRLETELMALFRDTRSPLAFEALYASARPALRDWILHLLASRRQPSDPADVLQDTFVNVYRYAAGFREGNGNSFRGWARTIAANVVRRAQMRARGRLVQEEAEGLEPADQQDGPQDSASAFEEQRSLAGAWKLLLLHYAACWRRLAPRDRLALHLVEVEGLSYEEAGERLGVGRSNMKMIMFRARKRLRAHMQRAMAEAERPRPRLRAAS